MNLVVMLGDLDAGKELHGNVPDKILHGAVISKKQLNRSSCKCMARTHLTARHHSSSSASLI